MTIFFLVPYDEQNFKIVNYKENGRTDYIQYCTNSDIHWESFYFLSLFRTFFLIFLLFLAFFSFFLLFVFQSFFFNRGPRFFIFFYTRSIGLKYQRGLLALFFHNQALISPFFLVPIMYEITRCKDYIIQQTRHYTVAVYQCR